MAVNTIVNGYFRTGTTAFWEIFKESNPAATVFYEPCNNALFEKLEAYALHRQQDVLHGRTLWEEYYRFDGLIDRLRATHPYIGAAFPSDNKALATYVQQFHHLPGDVVLQTNRWHFSLEYLARRFRCDLIHIIRNPVDVYNSIQIASAKEKSPMVQKLLKPLEPILRPRAFRSDLVYREVEKRCGPAPGNGSLARRVRVNFSAFEQHFISWLQTNFRAIRQVERVGGLLISYEAASRDPEAMRRVIENNSPLSASRISLLRHRPEAEFLTPGQEEELDELAIRSGLREDWNLVKAAVENSRS